MATLEKIRSKSVLLIIVIGVALLAFIVGDAISNGRNLFGKGSRVAKVGSEKIDATELQRRTSEISELYNSFPQQSKDMLSLDQSEFTSLALQQLMDEKLLDNAVSEMGIEVDDNSLSFYVLENPLSPVYNFIVQNQDFFGARGIPGDPKTVLEAINNPSKYGIAAAEAESLKQGWIAMEHGTRDAVKRHKYTMLLSGAIRPNSLDRKDISARANESVSATVAFKAFDAATLDAIKVTDADLKALYDEVKEKYRVYQPTATIGFAFAEVGPSADDIAKVNDLSKKAGLALVSDSVSMPSSGVESDVFTTTKAYLANSSNFKFPYNFAKIDSVAVGSLVQDVRTNMDGIKYYINLVKSSQKVANDSITLDLFTAAAADVDTVINVLKSGVGSSMVAEATNKKATFENEGNPFRMLLHHPAGAVGFDPQSGQLFNPGFAADIVAELDSASVGKVLTLRKADEKNPALLARVEKVVPATVYQFKAANVALLPSAETLAEAREKMSTFASKNSNVDAFKKNAEKAGYTYLPFTVDGMASVLREKDQSGRTMRMFPNSGRIIEWAMDGKAVAGDVSEVSDNGNPSTPMIYVAVLASQADEYLPVSDPKVKEELTDIVKRRKAGEKLVKEYSGKGDINATATAMGVSTMPMTDLRFGSVLPTSARIVGTAPGKKVYVVADETGVLAYTVEAKNENTTKADASEEEQAYLTSYGIRELSNPLMIFQSYAPNANPLNQQILDRLGKLLRGAKQIENNRYELMGGGR